jgi:hypothetical protein
LPEVANFQRVNGLPPTGVVDARTQEAMGNPNSISNAQVKATQQSLKDLGYYSGPVDGAWSPGSQQALAAFESTHRLPSTGRLTPQSLAVLQSGNAVPASKAPDAQRIHERVFNFFKGFGLEAVDTVKGMGDAAYLLNKANPIVQLNGALADLIISPITGKSPGQIVNERTENVKQAGGILLRQGAALLKLGADLSLPSQVTNMVAMMDSVVKDLMTLHNEGKLTPYAVAERIAARTGENPSHQAATAVLDSVTNYKNIVASGGDPEQIGRGAFRIFETLADFTKPAVRAGRGLSDTPIAPNAERVVGGPVGARQPVFSGYCGHACVTNVNRTNGGPNVSMWDLTRTNPPPADGLDIFELEGMLEGLGHKATAVKNFNILQFGRSIQESGSPAILLKDGHFITIDSVDGGFVNFRDPLAGTFRAPLSDFSGDYHGVVMGDLPPPPRPPVQLHSLSSLPGMGDITQFTLGRLRDATGWAIHPDSLADTVLYRGTSAEFVQNNTIGVNPEGTGAYVMPDGSTKPASEVHASFEGGAGASHFSTNRNHAWNYAQQNGGVVVEVRLGDLQRMADKGKVVLAPDAAGSQNLVVLGRTNTRIPVKVTQP